VYRKLLWGASTWLISIDRIALPDRLRKVIPMGPTILDVIENFWGHSPIGKIENATGSALHEFGKEVNNVYEATLLRSYPLGN